jgi:hypothetical protein
MQSFNDWITQNTPRLQSFLNEISQVPSDYVEPSTAQAPKNEDLANVVLLLKHCSNSWKQMEKQIEKDGASDLGKLMALKTTMNEFKSILDQCQSE